jgi:hypothetical protein
MNLGKGRRQRTCVSVIESLETQGGNAPAKRKVMVERVIQKGRNRRSRLPKIRMTVGT